MVSVITKFRGYNYYMSNRSDYKVSFFGLDYDRSENAFQAMKCINKSQREVFCKMIFKEAKKLGKRVNCRTDWNSIRKDVMFNILLCKFVQHRDIREKLIATCDIPLIEGNVWGDTYWGVCNGVGLNNMGKTLMNVREFLSPYKNPKYIYAKDLDVVIIKLNETDALIMYDEVVIERIKLMDNVWRDESKYEVTKMITNYL